MYLKVHPSGEEHLWFRYRVPDDIGMTKAVRSIAEDYERETGLRHTATTYWADATEGNEKVLNAIAGWGDGHVSGRYPHVSRSRLIRAARLFQQEVAAQVLPPEPPQDIE